MAKAAYSGEWLRRLRAIAEDPEFPGPAGRDRYEEGDELLYDVTTAWPEDVVRCRFRVLSFAGSGFAGQVYRCELLEAAADGPVADGRLRAGNVYAVKVLLPASRAARAFRNAVYAVGFQSPFSPQVNSAACRAGALWPMLIRKAWTWRFGRGDAVADVYGTFFDPLLGSYGEVREWVDGRTWRLEPDMERWNRRDWRRLPPEQTGSPEYVAKRQFMSRLVRLMHGMGAPELARQYEWWTMKSQPNVLKRSGSGRAPEAGLCAVDFRAGLALLPFFPMSIRDVGLIVEGMARGSPVQFDRADCRRLQQFVQTHGRDDAEAAAMAGRLAGYERAYRRSMPDVTHQGWALAADAALRRDVRNALVEAYSRLGWCDSAFAERLSLSAVRFAAFFLLGAVPFGTGMRRLWGRRDVRRHVGRLWREAAYRSRVVRAWTARGLVRWLRAGRVSEARSRRLQAHPGRYWIQRFTLAFLPSGLHRAVAEPSYVVHRIRDAVRFIVRFSRDNDFRVAWLGAQVEQGRKDGMLDDGEYREILRHVHDPFIVKYLKCVAVHFATLPVTQMVSLAVAGAAAVWALASGGTWLTAGTYFGLVLVFFQVMPVSPGSLCRGVYVVWLMVRERNFKDYMVAAPVSFVKYIGYLAFPMQMVTAYPGLARFLAGRWATGAVRLVPVFGEKGAWLEHGVFNLCFNVPMRWARWAEKRARALLGAWLAAGVLLLTGIAVGCEVRWSGPRGVNLILGFVVVFVLPRVLFYPALRRQRQDGQDRLFPSTGG